MIKKKHHFEIAPNAIPKVLLLGNGVLRLVENDSSWDALLSQVRMHRGKIDVSGIPYAMRPEALCGADFELIQTRVAEEIETQAAPHPLLTDLLQLPFDAILTTNYTYEIEQILSGGKWTDYARKKAFTALDDNSGANYNTFACNAVATPDGRTVPVFHIHGEKARKRSIILSYYNYANSLSKLVEYNKKLGNTLAVKQHAGEAHRCKCWLDYFILGDVWSVGFGLDTSEFDVWWAIERKARENNASHGKFCAYFPGDKSSANAQKVMLEAMGAECWFVELKNGRYETMYERAVKEIGEKIEK